MKKMKKIYLLLLFALGTLFSNAQVVISQAYGGGGNSGSTFTHDFIELFNAGSTAVNLQGHSVQYASATGATFSGITILPDFTLQPGQYFLVQQGQGSGGTTPLPTPDLIPAAPISMAGTNFKIVLANITTAVSGCSDAAIIDLVGFGTANCSEGTAAPVLSNVNAGIRLLNGCQDTNNNSADFIVAPAAPRNSQSPVSPCTADPALVIATPSNGVVFAPNASVSITFTVSNFVVGNPGTGINGHISYSVNGGTAVSYFSTEPIVLEGLTAGIYTVAMQLVDNNNTPLTPAVGATIAFEIAALNQVANLSALRQDVIANGIGKYYQVASAPVITYARTTRNQKYIQDATAGILIDDLPGTIATPMVAGDAINGLVGRTSYFNGLLQLLPTANATIATSGNSVEAQTVTLEMINENVEAYESELVYLSTVSITEADGTAVFATNTNYNLTDSQNSIVLRTGFAEANYIGEIIPSGQRNVIALVAKFVNATNNISQLIARSMADLDAPLSAPAFDDIDGLSMYPNPNNTGMVFVSSHENLTKNIAVYNMLGKEVMKTSAETSFSVSGLSAGVYVVKITENGKTATRKLVIN